MQNQIIALIGMNILTLVTVALVIQTIIKPRNPFTKIPTESPKGNIMAVLPGYLRRDAVKPGERFTSDMEVIKPRCTNEYFTIILKFMLDYGMKYDFRTPAKEIHDARKEQEKVGDAAKFF
jgi:hypothetical protein